MAEHSPIAMAGNIDALEAALTQEQMDALTSAKQSDVYKDDFYCHRSGASVETIKSLVRLGYVEDSSELKYSVYWLTPEGLELRDRLSQSMVRIT